MRAIILASTALVLITGTAHAQSVKLGSDITVEEGADALVKLSRTGDITKPSMTTLYSGQPSDTAIPLNDYTPLAIIQLWNPGESAKTINVKTLDRDAAVGSTKRLTMKLVVNRGASLSDGTQYITIKGMGAPVVVPPTCPPGTVLDGGTCVTPPPQPVQCPDGSTVIPPAVCPPVVIPPTPPGDIPVPVEGAGLPPIASPFDPMLATQALTTTVPSAAPDVLGAIRLTCGSAGSGRFDPKVYPGDHTGKSHLHDFYGYVAVTPDSTYQSIRGAPASEGRSTCNYGPYTAQRSAYWQPQMIEGGSVVRPDYVTIYYKQRPIAGPKKDPTVTDPSNPRYMGKGVELPNGLFYIFGYDMITNTPATGTVRYITVEPGANGQPDAGPQTEFTSLAAAANSGRLYPGSALWVRGAAPTCWTGKVVDSANHRSHMAYPSYGSWGYLKCPSTHPYVTVEYSLITTWRIRTGDTPKTWHWSSDEMHPELPAGSTYHADVWFNWDPVVVKIGQQGCQDQLLNCSSGRLSQTVGLKNAGAPMYPDANGNLVASWTVPDQYRKVPIPGPEANDKIIGPKY